MSRSFSLPLCLLATNGYLDMTAAGYSEHPSAIQSDAHDGYGISLIYSRIHMAGHARKDGMTNLHPFYSPTTIFLPS